MNLLVQNTCIEECLEHRAASSAVHLESTGLLFHRKIVSVTMLKAYAE